MGLKLLVPHPKFKYSRFFICMSNFVPVPCVLLVEESKDFQWWIFLNFRSPFSFMQMSAFGCWKLLGPPPMSKNLFCFMCMSEFAQMQRLILVQEPKEYKICKILVAIFIYANEDIWSIKTAGPPSYVQELFLMSIYGNFFTHLKCTFGANDKRISAMLK